MSRASRRCEACCAIAAGAEWAGPTELIVRASVLTGFHVHAHGAGSADADLPLIPTTLRVVGRDDVTADYAPGEERGFAFADRPVRVYSGEVEFYAAGANKVEAVTTFAKERGYDLAECYAYSDSASDLPLLECVGHPTAVNPDRALRRIAAESGWPVLEFRYPVPLGKRLRERPAVPMAAAALGVGVGLALGIALYGRHRRARAATPA